jgi:iron(III) transport system permease protein
MPGIVVALALVFFGARLNGIQTPGLRWLAALYQSLPMLILGYAIRFLPEAMGSFRMSLLQLNPRLEEAGRGLGRSAWAVFFAITLPMLAPGLLAGMGLVFLTTIKELPITLLLAPTGFETLVGEVWSNATEGLFAQASPPALVLVAMSALLIVLILRAERRGQYG